MFVKGRQALFFVIGFLVVGFSLWKFYPGTAATSAGPPTLWLFYARATGIREALYARHYSSQGHPLGRAISLGRLGLVQETEVASAGLPGWEWVTLGTCVVGIYHGAVVRRLAAPAGMSALSIADLSGNLYAVVESPRSQQVAIDRWSGRGWRQVLGDFPVGITLLVPGSHHTVWVWVADPHRAWLFEVSGGLEVLHTPRIEPQGSVGFSQGHPLVPYAKGTNTFGYWNGREHVFSSVYEAAISVTDTIPLWGLGVHGMIPYRHGRFAFRRTVFWPHPQTTSPQALSSSGSWVAILDGFSQGVWFNVATGRFGPGFQIKTPWWAVVRAASLGS